ncbi:MAG TPA: TolC family protein, partial [Nevskiaceae bacterium]|nr:TolC family protein [Nevskiaceae bacterium]
TLRAAQLAALAGRDYDAVRKLRDEINRVAPTPQDERAWTDIALKQNPKVLAQQMAVEVAGYQSKRASGRRFPRIDVVGGYWHSNADGGIPFRGNEDLSRIGARVTLPLFTGGQISSAVREADEMEQSAQQLLEDAKRQAVLDTRQAFLSCNDGLQKVPALRHALEASIAQIDAVTGGYEAGTRSYADVLAAVQQRYAEESAWAAARYDFLLQTLKLKAASGTLVPDDLARLNALLESAASP